MNKKKWIIVALPVSLILLYIAINVWMKISSDNRLERFEKIRENYNHNITGITGKDVDEYIEKLNVYTDFSTDESNSMFSLVYLNDDIEIDILFKESFNNLKMEDRIIHMRGAEETLEQKLAELRRFAGYDNFFYRNGGYKDHFDSKGIKYESREKVSITYCCGVFEYKLEPMTLTENDLAHRTETEYYYSYNNGELTDFAERSVYEKRIEKKNTTESSSNTTAEQKAVKRKYSTATTTEKSHDPDDYDIDAYYDDYKDEFEDEDDAWDEFEDNEMWDEE